MADFEINLIRDRVLSKPLRKGLFWGILVYLILCSVGLAVVVHRAALRMVDAADQHREMKVIREQFHSDHPDEKDVLSYAQGLRQRMVTSADVLAGVGACLRENVSLPPILLGLAKPLPDDCVLVNVDLDVKKGTIQFSVMTPARKGRSMTAGQIIDHWNREGTLNSYLKEIRAETSERQYSSGMPVLVHRFSASFVTVSGGA